MRQYKCIITLSQSVSCSYHICFLHIYWFWWAVACSLGGNSEYDIFPQELVFCNFPTYLQFLVLKKGKISHDRKGMSKIQNFLDSIWHRRISSVILLIPARTCLGSPSYFDYIAVFLFHCQLDSWSINCETEV